MVFEDAAPAPATPARSRAPLGSNGTADFAVQGRAMNATAVLTGLVDAPTELVVTTTVGIEVVPCFETAGLAYCIGTLIGDPMINGTALLANNRKVLSKGKIVQVP